MTSLIRYCEVCEWREARARGPVSRVWCCPTCYEYERRTGEIRPREAIVAHGRRVAEDAGLT